MSEGVRLVRDIPSAALRSLLDRYDLELSLLGDGQPITASFWGDSEAGIIGRQVYVRGDTPIHSLLHETSHIICMTDERREKLDRDAGGNDLEESAVCYLQIVLADEIAGIGRARLMRDMDAWGYSFRLGSTSRWFADDADDARAWLLQHHLLTESGQPTFKLRS